MDCTNKKPLRVVYGDFTLGVHGEGFDYIFSYAQGGLESIVKNGYEWLYRCPKPTFWRALTDNDRGSRFHIKSGSSFNPGDGFFKSRGGNYLRGSVIGHGDIPVYQCLSILKDKGYDGWVSVEFEGIESCLKGIEIGFNNLKRMIDSL